MRHLALSLAVVALVACSTPAPEPKPRPSSGDQLAQAATTPLNDLNLVRAEIPPVLVAAQKAPYAAPAEHGCEGLTKEVQALDAVLGADLDTPATAANPGLVERSGDVAMGAVRDAATGIVPFRGWVRKLTGAERYARSVAAAIAAGRIRRAYLKGLGQAAGCAAPAAPAVPRT